MLTSRRIAFSLVISVLLYGAFSALAFIEFFDLTQLMSTLPFHIKNILLLSFFLAIFLIIFLLFGLRQDPAVLTKKRQKQLRNKFWDELLAVMRSGSEADIDEGKLKSVLRDILTVLSEMSSSGVLLDQMPGDAAVSKSTRKPSFLKKASAMVQDNNGPESFEDPGAILEIEEREGVPFISGDVLKFGQKNVENINKDFKDLVDSVIK